MASLLEILCYYILLIIPQLLKFEKSSLCKNNMSIRIKTDLQYLLSTFANFK